jgi:C4-dicarboxylate-specific signal transduction histidine kinase
MTGAAAQTALRAADWALHEERSPQAYLLHALNQPLTGLQCLLELATAGPRPAADYVRTLHEALDLTARMRILVETLGELAEPGPVALDDAAPVRLDSLLLATVCELEPVAKEHGVQFQVTSEALSVRGNRTGLAGLWFRTLECALSLAENGSDLDISAAPEIGRARISFSWKPGVPPAHSPFSRPELGLLIARSHWQRIGGEWTMERKLEKQVCAVRLPLAPVQDGSGETDRAVQPPEKIGGKR